MKLMNWIKRLLFGMKIFVTMTDGTYCSVNGVRKIIFVKRDVWFMRPDGASADGVTKTFMEFRGIFHLKATLDINDVVTYSFAQPSAAPTPDPSSMP